MGLSINAYAKHRDTTHVAVLKAIKSGRITKNPDGTIDPEIADAEWEQNTNPALQRITPPQRTERPIEPPMVNGGPSYAQSRAIKEAYLARLAKLEYEQKSGILVRSDEIKVAWFNVLRVLRDRTLNLPDRLSPVLAAETDAKAVHDLLENELRQILTDAADELTKQS